MKHLILLSISALFFICSISNTYAQRHIYLNKIGKKFNRSFYKDDIIKFKLTGDSYFTTGRIQYISDSSFMVYETNIPIKDIETIDLNPQRNSSSILSGASGKVIIAGLFLPLIDLINQGDAPTPAIWTVSGSIVLAGFLLKLIENRKFYPGRKNCSISIID